MKKTMTAGIGILVVGFISMIYFMPVSGSEDTVQSQQAPSGVSRSQASGASSGEPKNSAGVTRVGLQKIQLETVVKSIALTGSVIPARTARIASPTEGPVINCTVREGDRVKAGQKILEIGRTQGSQAQVSAAETALREQEQELARIEKLVQSGAIPGAQLDTVRSRYENVKAILVKARESVADYLVKAPWNGVVSRVLVQDGDYVVPKAPLVEIFDPESLVIRFSVPEATAVAVKTGLKLNVNLDAYPEKRFSGKIDRVYPELEPRMRTRTIEAALENSVPLIPGMFARIELILETLPGALMIPAEAVVQTPKGDRSVFLLRDGKAVRKPVQTGLEADNRIQILCCVKPGDQIIVSGNDKLKDGDAVKPMQGDG